MQRDARRRSVNNANHANNYQNGPSHSVSAAISMAVTWLVWYFAGPVVSWISRSLWNSFCNYWYVGHYEGFFGTILGNVRWFTNCMPWGEHLGNYAYRWSDALITGVAGGFTYFFSHMYQRIRYRARTLANAGAQRINHELNQGLNLIQAQLEDYSHDDNSDGLGSREDYLPLRKSYSSDDVRRSSNAGAAANQRAHDKRLK